MGTGGWDPPQKKTKGDLFHWELLPGPLEVCVEGQLIKKCDLIFLRAGPLSRRNPVLLR